MQCRNYGVVDSGGHYHQRINLRVFFGRAKIGGGGGLELVLRNEGKFWYKVPCCCFLVDGCYFLVASGWLLLFPGGLWMVAVISWWPLDGMAADIS